MNSQLLIPFPDGTRSYEQVMEDLSTRIAIKLRQFNEHPEILSQNEAWKIFTKKKVQDWVSKGLYEPRAIINPQTGNITKIEYSYSALLELQANKQ